ncbi:uncharacterized protein [Dermacentor albipictus]|uniref:uncharacterized protein isoform X2 n=1 Tax=Dermacentor albipictus TaxID=60249 RepID=UPI0031FC4E4C
MNVWIGGDTSSKPEDFQLARLAAPPSNESLRRLSHTGIGGVAGEEHHPRQPRDNEEGGVRRSMIVSLVASMVFSIAIYAMWHVLEVSYRHKAGALVKAEDDSATKPAMVSGRPTQVTAPSLVCTSSSCEQFSSIFQDALSYDQEPCSDFYQFVCKRWSLRLPHEYTVKEEHRHRIVALMSRVLKELPHSAATSSSEAKAVNLYWACMQPKRNVEALREFMRIEGVTLDDDDESGEHPLKHIVHLNVHYGFQTIFNVGRARRDAVAQCSGANWTFVFEKVDVHMYAPFIEDLTGSAHFIKRAFALVTGKDIPAAVLRDIIRVDAFLVSLLHRFTWLPVRRAFQLGNGGVFAANVTVADMFLYLGETLDIQFDVKDCIVVTSIHVIQLVEKILAKFSTTQLNRYVQWSVLRRIAPIAEPALLEPMELRHYYCYTTLERLLHYALSRRFLDSVGVAGGAATREASSMISIILRSTLSLVEASSWMSVGQKINIRLALAKKARVSVYRRLQELGMPEKGLPGRHARRPGHAEQDGRAARLRGAPARVPGLRVDGVRAATQGPRVDERGAAVLRGLLLPAVRERGRRAVLEGAARRRLPLQRAAQAHAAVCGRVQLLAGIADGVARTVRLLGRSPGSSRDAKKRETSDARH